MCFHSKLTQKASSIEQRFNAKMMHAEDYTPNAAINGFTHPKTPVITKNALHVLDAYEWGLIPHWAKDDSIQNNTLNARIETLSEKASFKNILHQRCLIISEGFYEWQHLDATGKQKQKYLIHKTNHELFAFGGLYSVWEDPMHGSIRKTYTIVTTEAQGFMREIHNNKLRMPVVLSAEQEGLWLKAAPFETFRSLCNDLTASAL